MSRVPLFRLQGNGDHFYTTSADERDNAITQYGYHSEGIACYVESEPASDPPLIPSVPIRDQFAIAAMAALIASHSTPGHFVADMANRRDQDAYDAYAIADALLRARKP